MKRFRNILYVAEASAEQAPCVSRAISLAENNQAALTIIEVIPPIRAEVGLSQAGKAPKDLQATVLAERHKLLAALVEPYKRNMNVRLEVLAGTVFLEVIKSVLRDDHDLVIKAAENLAWIDRIFGSDDMHLLRKCPCPVWLMKPNEKSNYESIVVAIDFNPLEPELVEQGLNRDILGLAASLALSDFASLHIVHAWDAPEAEFVRLWTDNPDAAAESMIEGERGRHTKGMRQLQKQLQEQLGSEAYEHLAPLFHMPKGNTSRVVPALCDKLHADLVVMGTVARAGLPGMIIGNTAESILDQIKCSVLAIKPPGFVSPVPA